jgi:hypothetical protein
MQKADCHLQVLQLTEKKNHEKKNREKEKDKGGVRVG